MLTQTQRDTFRLALAALNNYTVQDVAELDISEVIEDDQVVETAETIEQFFDSRGRKLNRKGERPVTPFELNKTIVGEIYKWEAQQSCPGKRRGDLYVMDFGTARACYFDGEV